MTLRMIRCTTFVLLLLACSSRAVTAQGATDFPSKPITIVIPTAASVSGDILMRAYGEAVSKHLGQPIIVENKPGGSGALAAAYVATSVKPDGYTLLNITIPIYRVPYIQKTPYDPVKDFTPIILLGGYTLGGVVKADSPFKEWKDVIEFSKANPGRFTYTTVGPQTTNAIAMETMARHSGVQFTHVPGKGGGEGISAVLGGHVQCDGGKPGLGGPRRQRRDATAVPAQPGAQQEVAGRADHQGAGLRLHLRLSLWPCRAQGPGSSHREEAARCIQEGLRRPEGDRNLRQIRLRSPLHEHGGLREVRAQAGRRRTGIDGEARLCQKGMK